MATPPTPEIVQVDVEKEINRLAEIDGIKHPAELNLKVEITKKARYRDTVIAYYRGRDDGFAEGVALSGPLLAKAMLRRFYVGIFLGFLLGGVTVVTILNHFNK